MRGRHGGSRSFVLGGLLSALGACGPAPSETGLELDSSRLCQQVDSVAAALPRYVTLDDRFEALAAILPGGYGGATLQYMVLVEPGKAPLVAEAIRIGTTCQNAHAITWSLAVRSQVVKGDYDFGQLARWKRKFYATDMSDLHLVVVDINEVRNRLYFGVTAPADIDAVRARATQLGVPQAALVVEVVVPPKPL